MNYPINQNLRFSLKTSFIKIKDTPSIHIYLNTHREIEQLSFVVYTRKATRLP